VAKLVAAAVFKTVVSEGYAGSNPAGRTFDYAQVFEKKRAKFTLVNPNIMI
jgi:hypothetical protein